MRTPIRFLSLKSLALTYGALLMVLLGVAMTDALATRSQAQDTESTTSTDQANPASETPAANPEETSPSPQTTPEDAKADPPIEANAEKTTAEKIDEWFGKILVAPLSSVVFYDFAPLIYGPAKEGEVRASVPLVVLWLLAGAIFFTVRMGFINIRCFWLAIRITKGDFDDHKDSGEVSHFQALSSALSATVGLGNIAGVAIAVGTGGPGAIFWLVVMGLLGMSSKFTECSLGMLYRKIAPDGTVSGGPMHYLYDGLKTMGLGPLGYILSLLFAVMCIGGSFGGGCAFQVSQSMGAVALQFPFLKDTPWIYGLVMTVMAALVIIGGIRRIATVADKIVPIMCGMYVIASLTIIFANFAKVPDAVMTILSGAFNAEAVYGGFLGVMVKGIQRAAFSNEAGVGSASIAHSAAKTEEPISEGIVALLEPFIDTVVVCTMTGIVVVVTGVYDLGVPEYKELIDAKEGAKLTSVAFATQASWFPWILTATVFLFAYSTIISWSYYGERCATFLFGTAASMPYKILFLCFVFLGSIVTRGNIIDFSDLMILSMAFPNIFGAILLSGHVKRELDKYLAKVRSGALERK